MWSAGKMFTLCVVGIFVLALFVRMIGIGSFMTVDEEKWMIRSGKFYEKLLVKNDPGGTFTTTHPGATTQWLAGFGISWKEKQLGTGIDTSNLSDFRLVSTVPIAIAVSLLIVGIVFLVSRLMGYRVGIWAGLLLATEPYLVGMSQVVHLDMLLALFMLVSALCILLYTEEKKWLWLMMGGIFMGLSFGTKLMPALWLVIWLGVVLVFDTGLLKGLWEKDWGFVSGHMSQVVRIIGSLVGVAMIVFYLVWPALWVKTDLNNSYQRDVVSVTTQEHIAQAESIAPIQPITFYARTVLGRVSPFVLFITLGMIIVVIKHVVGSTLLQHFVGKLARHDNIKDKKMFVSANTIGWLAVYAIGYLALITLAAKKADRYALPALVVFPVLAGAGLVVVWIVVREKIKFLESKKRRYALMLFIIFSLLLQPISWAPYAISYNSNLFNVRPLTQQGWGEGLDAAARWMNSSPLVDRLTIASWYPGVMRTYFNGKTMSLSSRDDDRVGYVVTYRNMGNRAPDDIATNVLDEFMDIEPVHVIKIGGVDYVYIYETLGLHYFPRNIGELIGDIEVGQVVIAPEHWDGIEIGMSNYSGRKNTQEVVLHVRGGVNESEDIRTVKANASEIEDGQWHKFMFDAIEGFDGEEFYVALTSPKSVKGDAITVRFVDRDVLSGKMVWRNRLIREGEQNEIFSRPGYDLAYRLPTR